MSTLVLRPTRRSRGRPQRLDALRDATDGRSVGDRATVGSLNLGFHERGGPLLALAGVCGGAGTSMLAYLVAAAAALESSAPVLLADLGGPGASIAAYAGVASPGSFSTLAQCVARGLRPREAPFATGEHSLRLLAAAPRVDEPTDESSARLLLDQAAAAHGLTVLDCGQLTREVEQAALKQATHLAWVLPATTVGLRRAHAVLPAVARDLPAGELVIARHDGSSADAALESIALLAEQRGAPLVLVPRLDDLVEQDTARVIDQAALALQALGGFLHR